MVSTWIKEREKENGAGRITSKKLGKQQYKEEYSKVIESKRLEWNEAYVEADKTAMVHIARKMRGEGNQGISG